MSSSHLFRIQIISGAILLSALLLVARLFFLQIVYGQEFGIEADNQHLNLSSGIFFRGSIFFQEKSGNLISAATLRPRYIVAINPIHLKNPNEAFEKIKRNVSISEQIFFNAAARKNDPYEVIYETNSTDEANALSGLGITGLIITKDNSRFYTAGRLASHLLGFVGRIEEEGDHLAGRYGLEKFYEKVLSADNLNPYRNFFADLFQGFKNRLSYKSGRDVSGDIVLNIEPAVQSIVEESLSSVFSKTEAAGGGAIVVDPKTGKIVAMAVRPDFDPNNLADSEAKYLANPLVENVFEMGSVFKPITLAAAIDSGVVTVDTVYEDRGFIEVSGAKISNHDGKSRGLVNMQEVINQSLNTGAVFMAREMGRDLFSSYVKGFGFGKIVGIDLPNETPNLINNLESLYEIDYVTMSFGQGVAVTPIAMVQALTALANKGEMMRPYLVDRIVSRFGIDTIIKPVSAGRIIKPETAEEVSRVLTLAFDNALLGGKKRMEHFSIAAKTGTAQIPDTVNGGYLKDENLHSFFGYFPSFEPRFLIFLYLKSPRGVRFASDSLSDPFVDIVKFLINYYEIHPDR